MVEAVSSVASASPLVSPVAGARFRRIDVRATMTQRTFP
ncbi:hypothetical protein BURCENK562V_C3004 [Burkholderia cenocepacia K56-2Valvano]|nr:hypothetical protein BURCENK562V_C3004 [Burkholderia cenocepacia K56-2Valvano]